MAPRWISTKNIHAKDKPAQLCAHLPPPPNTTSSISKWPPKAFAKLQGHLWASCFPHFSESFLKKKKNKKKIKKKKKKKKIKKKKKKKKKKKTWGNRQVWPWSTE